MDAIDWLDREAYTYSVLYRTNVSQLTHWDGLKRYVHDTQAERPLAAGMWYKEKHMSGACMLLSADLVGMLSRERTLLDWGAPDDHAINMWLHQYHAEVPIRSVEAVLGRARGASV